MRIGIVIPHIFMHRDILPRVIFSPGEQAQNLAEGLAMLGHEVTLFTPGPIDTTVRNVTADLTLFEAELTGRGYGYVELLQKHALVFTTLARQVQAELLATAYQQANDGMFDIIHVYTNEEEIGLAFARFCQKPVVFTHHDPFNFLIRYKSSMPKYAQLPWISMSLAQRAGMPDDTNWLANIYHGMPSSPLTPAKKSTNGYVAFLGRIIEPKGLHLAIAAVKQYNKTADTQLQLKIAGKHYAGHAKDTYWQTKILPLIDGIEIQYDGFIRDSAAKQAFLANAEALIVPSLFEEPFGMVLIESLACGTPVIGLDRGAIPEVIRDNQTGFVVHADSDDGVTVSGLANAITKRDAINRQTCRAYFEANFTVKRMCIEHVLAYEKLIG